MAKLPEEQRLLTMDNYIEKVLPYSQGIYVPVTMITPSELEGLTLEQEREVRIYACDIV